MVDTFLRTARYAALDFFRPLQASKLIQHQNLVSASVDTSIMDVCLRMHENKVSSVVIMDENKFFGLVDYRNIVSFISELVERDGRVAHNKEMLVDGLNVPIRGIIDPSIPKNHYLVLKDTSVIAPIEIMMYGIHKVAVVDMEGKMEGVLSRTDIFKFLVTNRTIMENLERIPIDYLGRRSVESCTITSPLITAFSKMARRDQSSISIIEKHGRIVGNVSSKDVHYLLGNVVTLQTSCLDLISTKLLDLGIENKGRDKYPFFAVSEDSNIGQTIKRLMISKTHQVWVTGEDFQPSGIISMDDILHFLFSGCE